MQENHQLDLEQKDAALALILNNLRNNDNRIQSIQYNNTRLQGEIPAKNL